MATSSTPQPLLATPRHWPTWMGLGLLRAASRLPQGGRMALGAALGRLYLRLGKRRRRIAAINLQLCFPELDEAQREELLRRHFESMGKGLLELGMAWWGGEKACRRLGRIEGREHVDRALQQGKGVLLFSAHFSSTEISGRLLRLLVPEWPTHALYRPNENPVIDRVMRRRRALRVADPIPRNDLRSMLKALRKGEIVWYAADQNYGHKGSVFADFFGVPAATNTAVSRLAERGQAVLIPFFPYRLPDDTGYVIEIAPPLEGFPSGDPREDAERLNRIIEGWARRHPEQYFWIHRRFKDRPGGEDRFY